MTLEICGEDLIDSEVSFEIAKKVLPEDNLCENAEHQYEAILKIKFVDQL